MREKEEIQNAHDILHSAITNILQHGIKGVLEGQHLLTAQAALDALCFTLEARQQRHLQREHPGATLLPAGVGYLFLSFPTQRPGYGSNYTNVTPQQSINAARQYANAIEDGNVLPTPNGN